MDAPQPKRKKRRWPWVLVIGVMAFGVAVWVILPSDKIEEGDAGYRQMVYDYKVCLALKYLARHLPSSFTTPMSQLELKTSRRIVAQLFSLQDVEYICGLRVVLTNSSTPLTNIPPALSRENASTRLISTSPDKRYPPFNVIYTQNPNVIALNFICRRKDASAFITAFGASNVTQEFGLPGTK